MRGEDYFQLISAEGEVLVSTDEQYVDMDPMSDLPFFKVIKDTGDALNCNGMIDGTGKLLVPAKYALVEDYSERWLVGLGLSLHRRGRPGPPFLVRQRLDLSD